MTRTLLVACAWLLRTCSGGASGVGRELLRAADWCERQAGRDPLRQRAAANDQ